MTQINYFHICVEMKCNSCLHTGHDIDFKAIWKTLREEKGLKETELNYQCPKCQSIDTAFAENGKPTKSTIIATWNV